LPWDLTVAGPVRGLTYEKSDPLDIKKSFEEITKDSEYIIAVTQNTTYYQD